MVNFSYELRSNEDGQMKMEVHRGTTDLFYKGWMKVVIKAILYL